MSDFPTYGSYWPTDAARWDAMERTRKTAEDAAASKLLRNKSRYKSVEAVTGVPWWWIAITHLRESDADFNTQLAQGDPLDRVSTHEPAGMGPYRGGDAWERAAIEGLEHDGVTEVIDWRLEKALYWWQKWNGWGYWLKGVVSPYVWAGSNQYIKAKFIADNKYDPNAVDQQLGAAPVLKSLMELDPTIKIERETPPGVEPKPEPPMTQLPPAVTPVPAPVSQHGFDLSQLEHGLTALEGFASSPWLLPLIPVQYRPFLAIIPISKEVVEALQQWQDGTHDLQALTNILTELVTDIANELKLIKAQLAKPV